MLTSFKYSDAIDPCIRLVEGSGYFHPSISYMDYAYLQRFGLDHVPVTEERNLFSSTSAQELCQYLAYSSPFPPLPMAAPDPTLLQTNEHAWLNGLKIPPADIIGVDTSGQLPHQRPNIVMQNSQFNFPSGIMTAAISSGSFQLGGDVATHAPWRQMYSLSSDDYLNDAMPQLISDTAVQQPCLYTSFSGYPHEADSCGSSERGGPLSRSHWVGFPSDEMNSGISDVLQGNLGGSTAGFTLDGLRNYSSSVAPNLDDLDSSHHALSSLVSMPLMPGPTGDCLPLWPLSWMSPSMVESGNSSMVTGLLNDHSPSLGPFGASLSADTNGAPPYKRQRGSCSLQNSSARPLSKPAIPALSSSTSTKSSGSDYPMTPMNITDEMYKDFHVSRRQILSLPKPTIFEAVGGLATKRDQRDNDVKSPLKQIATSIEPQSVAARHRRRKISERVRILERLIPGGNKMDTASLLDESIEYVKFLQLQVQLLETLGDMSGGNSVTSTPSFSYENIGRGKDGLDKRTSSFGSQVPQTCTTMQLVRPAASPLILSEILQQQLFKQKLCLVSLCQCAPTTRSSASGAYT